MAAENAELQAKLCTILAQQQQDEERREALRQELERQSEALTGLRELMVGARDHRLREVHRIRPDHQSRRSRQIRAFPFVHPC